METVTNQKGGRTLLFEGYVYTVDRQTNDKTLWRCCQKGQCKVVSLLNVLMNIHTPHPARMLKFAEPHTRFVRRRYPLAIVFPADALPILGYFEDTYMGRQQRRGSFPPTNLEPA